MPLGMDTEAAIAERMKNRARTEIPTGPCKRRVPARVPRVGVCTCRKKQADVFFVAKRGGSVKGSLALRPAITHEAAGFRAWYSGAVRIGAGRQKNAYHWRVPDAIRLTKGRMERTLARVGVGVVNICPTLDKELTELPMPVKTGTTEIEVLTERAETCPLSK